MVDKTSKFEVALEFGFSRSKIFKAMRRQGFENAGDLIAYLDEHDDSEDSEDDSVVPLEQQLQQMKLVDNPLWRETVQLYVKSHCLVCKLEKRSIITLPCCHFSLCSKCARKTLRCPLKECEDVILQTLHVFQA